MAGCIILSMIYINAFLPWDRGIVKQLPVARSRPGSVFLQRSRPFIWREAGEEAEIAYYMLPERWMKKPEKLKERLPEWIAAASGSGEIWVAPEIRNVFPWRPEVPDTELMRLFWKGQKSYRSMIVVMPDFGKEDFYEEIGEEADCLRAFLGEDYGGLNGLLLISRILEKEGMQISLEEEVPYYAHIYQDTGLPVICGGTAASFGFADGVCIDMRPGYRIPFRRLPEKLLYLDMTSDPEKERLLLAKRKDICYRSALNFLDTYVRKRYNTNRY